jgi:hypothetical protein
MSNSVDLLVEELSALSAPAVAHSFVNDLTQRILVSDSERLVRRLTEVASGRFGSTDPQELASLVQWTGTSVGKVTWTSEIAEGAFSDLPQKLREDSAMLFLELLEKGIATLSGDVRLYSRSILKIVENSALLRLALRGTERGLSVRLITGNNLESSPPFKIALSGTSGGISITADIEESQQRSAWIINAWSGDSKSSHLIETYPSAPGLREVVVTVPAKADGVQDQSPEPYTEGISRETGSVADLFSDYICLRDLQPRTSSIRGLDALRDSLKLAAPFVPRKSEPDYARVVGSFVNELVGPDARIIYVGDTVFNDGSVICNLDAFLPGSTFGFLCNEKGFGGAQDFILGPVYFAQQWRSLVSFARECRSRNIHFDQNTVALFDLDQTVYAAKGRDDKALHQARWDAIQSFLRDTIPSYKYDAKQAERIYRQFDRDEYHHVTRDNMDYVVLLVLAVAAGLCDVREIEAFAASRENTISALTELLHTRALARQGHEKIEDVLNVIRAVHYNTLAGDQTPCKDFRRYECRATALRMRASDEGEDVGRICLNREVVDFIRYLKEHNAKVFAVSDRPVEAALVEEEADGQREDLMSIAMPIIGFPIYNHLARAG